MAEALEAQLPTSVVAWTLEPLQGDAYLLTNGGTANAYQVHLDLGDIQIVRGERDLEILRPGEARQFIAARSMGTANDTVTVSWLESPTSTKRSNGRTCHCLSSYPRSERPGRTRPGPLTRGPVAQLRSARNGRPGRRLSPTAEKTLSSQRPMFGRC